MNEGTLKHHWISDDTDVLAGRWMRPAGLVLCEWRWHTASQTLTIAVDGVEHESAFQMDGRLIQLERLKEVLPDISRHRAERRKHNLPKLQGV